jgi:recombinational DNA repair protein RecT
LAEEERGSEVWVYSCAETREGKVFIHLMESWHVDKIKKIALARTPNSPWANPIYEPEMRKKTAIRRHCKTLDVSPDLQIAIEHEESVERGEIPKYEIPEDLINQAIDETTQETIASDMPPEHMDFVNKP